jgi:hypothetical protein
MSEEQLEQRSKIILAKASEKKSKEKIEDTKERLKKSLQPRDAAMQDIRRYQQQTGIPSIDEVDKHFLVNEAGEKISLNEFRSKENEDDKM